MKFALIFNPFRYKVHEENIKVVQKYFGLFPPLSLAWVAAIAEKAGHEIIIVDARTLQLSKEETLAVLKDFRPDIMGFMMTTYMFPETLEWIRFLKKELRVPVVVGGYNLRVYPRESLSHPEIDFGVVEQAYHTVPQLFEQLGREKPHFEDVSGLVYKKNGNVYVTEQYSAVDFELFPHPARHLLPNELYAEFPTERRNFTVMVTSLGCPYRCEFCEAGGTPFNARSPEKVIAEIEECYEKYHIREIDIFDYQFTSSRKRIERICQLLGEKKIDIQWACRSRIDTVDRDLLVAMKHAGCNRIYFGLESGVQDILNKVGKGITPAQIKHTIGICKELNIKTLGFFLIGAPGDTPATMKQTYRFATELALDYVQFSKCLAKPRTPLWKEMVRVTGQDYWKDWILGKEIDRELPRPWTELTNREIDRFAKRCYVRYYLHPRRFWQALRNIRSFYEFKRKLSAFFSMVFSQESTAKYDRRFRSFNENSSNAVISTKERLKKVWIRKPESPQVHEQKG